MKLLYEHSDEVALWVGQRIPYVAKRLARDPMSPPFGSCQAIGVLNSKNELVGGVVYHNYDPDCPSIEMSFASTTAKWLTRSIISELLRYCYTGLQVRRVTACTPRRATSARKFLEAFGFKREGCARFGFGDDHAIISGLLASEWAQSRFNLERSANHHDRRALLGQCVLACSETSTKAEHGGAKSCLKRETPARRRLIQ